MKAILRCTYQGRLSAFLLQLLRSAKVYLKMKACFALASKVKVLSFLKLVFLVDLKCICTEKKFASFARAFISIFKKSLYNSELSKQFPEASFDWSFNFRKKVQSGNNYIQVLFFSLFLCLYFRLVFLEQDQMNLDLWPRDLAIKSIK